MRVEDARAHTGRSSMLTRNLRRGESLAPGTQMRTFSSGLQSSAHSSDTTKKYATHQSLPLVHESRGG